MKIKSIKNIKLKTKLYLLGVISITGLLIMGTESVLSARKLNDTKAYISDFWMPSVRIAQDLESETANYRIMEYNHVTTLDLDVQKVIEKSLERQEQRIADSFNEYTDFISDENDLHMMNQAKQYWEEYLICSKGILSLSKSNMTQAASQMMVGESRKLYDRSNELFEQVVKYNLDGAQMANQEGNRLYAHLIFVKAIMFLLVGAIIIVLITYLILALAKPMKDLVIGVRRVSNGDLDVYLDYEAEDEIGVLTESVNSLTKRLNTMITDEKYLFQEIGNENYKVKSKAEQAYRGDFAPILYAIESLKSRLEADKRRDAEELIYKIEKQEKERNTDGTGESKSTDKVDAADQKS